MKKFIKTLICIILLFIVCLLLSPVISLILPEKLTNRTYFGLAYQLISDIQTRGCLTEDEKAEKLFEYVVGHEFPQGTPYKCKPFESLIYAEGFCDFQARTLNALLGAIGIPSRYAMLFDQQGLSPHTLNEVFIGGKWCVFDVTMNIIFKDKNGNCLTLEEISENPSIIQNQKKMLALEDYRPGAAQHYISWYGSMFPLRQPPERSTSVIYQRHLLDWIAGTYFKIFGRNFFFTYQDLYLKMKKVDQPKDFRLFFSARNYHLTNRLELAKLAYSELLEKIPDSIYAEDAVFFSGMLYFDKGDYQRAVDYFTQIISNNTLKWSNPAYFYLGRSYDEIGDSTESIRAYSRMSVIYQLSPEILEKIKSIKSN